MMDIKLISNTAIDRAVNKHYGFIMKNLEKLGHAMETSKGTYLPTSLLGVIYVHQQGFTKSGDYNIDVEHNAELLLKGSNTAKNCVFSPDAKSLAVLYILN